MAGKTKDERYIIRFYEMAVERGDPTTPLNRDDVGRTIGFSPKVVKTICTLLGQANFIKKEDGEDISLTQNGIRLVEELRGQ
ncbi:MAG: hypothetical protein K940chlam3_01252 [Chlamydiae bacterium]|nr:hypothetical protein [Chlamydiota bacterium]